MGVQRQHPRAGAEETRASQIPPSPVSELREDVHPLGEALLARVEQVLELTVARTRRPGGDPEVQSDFEAVNRRSTKGLANWLAGNGPDVAFAAGKETWRFYGQLAAHRAASLNEVTMRCMCWRDAVVTVLQQSAAELEVSSQALAQALNIVQVSLEFSLVGMSKSFDKERERTDEELAYMATHDALTGLPNRTLILDRTEQMLVRARRHKTPVAVLFIGLDNFKGVNETLSHGAGDELLRAVAERLDGVVRDTDAFGRLGGDEFVVIAEELSLKRGPELIAERLLQALEAPFA